MKTKQILILIVLCIAFQIYCDNPRRYVTQDGSGLRDGSSWANAAGAEELQTVLSSIQDADIWVAKGIYKPTRLVLEPENERDKTIGPNFNLIYGGFIGNETELSQRNINDYETIFSGDVGIEGDNSDNCYHVMRAVQLLDGITICDGNANGLSDPNRYGGGVYVWSSPSIFRNCTFRDNYASKWGGAVFMDSWGYNVVFENCLFYNNESKYGGGGAIYSSYENTTITNCTFVKNTVTESGIVSFTFDITGLKMTNNIFWHNTGNSISYDNFTYSDYISNNAVEGGYDGFCNINLSSDNTGDTNSPYFTDPDNQDYSLLPQSPLIDKGVYWNTQCSTDITGSVRPSGTAWDIGAYEYDNGPLTTVAPTVSTLTAEFTTVSTARIRGNVTSDGGSQMITKGAYYSTIPGFDLLTQGIFVKYNQLYSAGEFYIETTNLAPNTTYYYRTFCENRVGSDTGEEMSFTTRSGISPDANGILYAKPDGTGNGSSWANALHGNDLQLGIDNADVKEIWLTKGKYVPTSFPNGGSIDRQKHFSLKQNVILYGGFNGTETALEQRDIKLNKTILSGDIGAEGEYLDNTYHVFYHTNRPEIDNTSVIDGITISDGYSASIARANSDKGGGMYNEYCSPSIRNCIFEENKTIYGGGIYNLAAFPNLKNCAVINNTSLKTGGGLFYRNEYDYKENSDAYQRTIRMSHCTVAGNTAPQSSQIALAQEIFEAESYIEIYNSIIWGTEPEMEWYDINNYHQMEVIPRPMEYSTILFCGLSYQETGKGNFVISRNNTGDLSSPYFTDPVNNDYSLQYNSKCKDMATYRYATPEDITQTPRPQGATFDTGAYEYITSEPNATAPMINTSIAGSVTASTAVCYTDVVSNGGTSLVERGVAVSSNYNFNPEIQGKLYSVQGDFFDNEFSNQVTDLQPSGTYYYRSFAENRMGYVYSQQESFTTDDIIPDGNGIYYVKENGIGHGDSWESAMNGKDLQAAINISNENQIWVAKGIYKPNSWPNGGSTDREKHFALKSGVEIYGGFNGTELNLSQRDYLFNRTTLSGDIGVENDSTDNCLKIIKNISLKLDKDADEQKNIVDSTAVLDGFTITKGYDDIENDYYSGGAAMYNKNATPSVYNCTFEGNYSINNGGAVYNHNKDYSLLDKSMNFVNCIFNNNESDSYAGAVYNQGFCKLNIENCIFKNNRSTWYCGALLTNGNANIKNSLFERNQAEMSGSAIIFDTVTMDKEIKITNSTIVNNHANILDGGICSFLTSNNTILTNSVLFNNGGNLLMGNEYYDTPDINNCAIEGELNFEYTGTNNITLSPNNTGDEFSPYFSDPDNNNWMIQEHSPLRDAGIYTELALYDIVGYQRDSLPDIGCYEWDPTGIEDNEPALPLTTKLYQNYPNPFNPVTNIKFDLSKTGKVELSIYNIAGQLVRKILDKEMSAGYHSVRFEADDLNSGMYFYTLKTNDKKLTRKMLMVK